MHCIRRLYAHARVDSGGGQAGIQAEMEWCLPGRQGDRVANQDAAVRGCQFHVKLMMDGGLSLSLA